MDDAAAPPPNPNVAEYAKSGRSTCKKCKLLVENKSLRLGKAFDNGERVMTSWYHVVCWPVPKALTDVSTCARRPAACPPQHEHHHSFRRPMSLLEFAARIANWHTLSPESQQQIILRAPNKAPPGWSLATAASTSAAAAAAAPAPASAPAPLPPLEESGGVFSDFVELVDRVAAVGSTLEKISIIKQQLSSLGRRAINQYLAVRLLLPGKAHDHRTYQLKDKSLLAHLSTVLRCREADMSAHLDSTQDGDVGFTAEHFFLSSSSSLSAPPANGGARLTLADVNRWLDRLAASDAAHTGSLIGELVGRCTPPELRVAMRLVRKDLRIGGGSAVVLKAVGGEAAYESFKASPHELQAICARAFGLTAAGPAAAGPSAAAPAATGTAARTAGIKVNVPFKPQLAGQCGSFSTAPKKFGRGFYVEIKYDGERLQAHLKDGHVRFYARSLKETPLHKVRARVGDGVRVRVWGCTLEETPSHTVRATVAASGAAARSAPLLMAHSRRDGMTDMATRTIYMYGAPLRSPGLPKASSPPSPPRVR